MQRSREAAVSWCDALEQRTLMSFTYEAEALDLSAMLGTEEPVTVVAASEQTTFLLGRMGDAEYALFGPGGATRLGELGKGGASQPIDVNERGDVLFHGRLWLNESGTAADPTGRFVLLEELVTRIDAPIELGAIQLDSLRLLFIADDRSIVLSTGDMGYQRFQGSPPQVWRLRGGVLTFLWNGLVYDIASDGSIAGARRTDEGRWQGVIARVDGTTEVTPGFIPTAIDASGVMAGVDSGGWGYVRDGERSRPLGQRFRLGHSTGRRPWEVNARGDVLIGSRHGESAFAPLWGRFGRVPLVAFGAPMSYETAIALDDQGAVVSGRSQTPYRLTVTDIDLTFALEPGADTLAGAFDDFVVAGVDQSGRPVRFIRGADGEWTASTELSVGAANQPGVGSGALVDPESGWRMAFTDGSPGRSRRPSVASASSTWRSPPTQGTSCTRSGSPGCGAGSWRTSRCCSPSDECRLALQLQHGGRSRKAEEPGRAAPRAGERLSRAR